MSVAFSCKRELQAVGCLWREMGISEHGRARDGYHGLCRRQVNSFDVGSRNNTRMLS
jgi:hypothetical protein